MQEENIYTIGRHNGKKTVQDGMLLETIYEGKKYTLFHSLTNKVHIIPDQRLKEIIEASLKEERERIIADIIGKKYNINELCLEDIIKTISK